MAKESRNDRRVARHQRIRRHLHGTPEKPRLCVFRSNKNISVQIIDDVNGVTLASASTIDKELKSEIKNGGNREAAKAVGEAIAKRALDKGIKEVTFDRGGFLYHGRVKELADSAREAGLEF
ncbi:MAG TPA: 50S ribosomal protein L18 [Candidatus Copromorpha excrementigallinarum]|uniref:Large ribosomal subunit protein uL18 n=1 Tax=Candidatus Allocopromorpha excrementigallinarum TaxID=2840742 RepID=A0A9D1I0A4_9FIRM|nr:50S ribosomal protein L18 [Candidatus Copromorpha excrementigallinarum]